MVTYHMFNYLDITLRIHLQRLMMRIFFTFFLINFNGSTVQQFFFIEPVVFCSYIFNSTVAQIVELLYILSIS